jgi:hypothetical protein
MAKKSSTKKKTPQTSKPLHAATAAVVSENSRTSVKAEAKTITSKASKDGVQKKNSAPANNRTRPDSKADNKANGRVSAKSKAPSKAKVTATPKVSTKTEACEKTRASTKVVEKETTRLGKTKASSVSQISSHELVPAIDISSSHATTSSSGTSSDCASSSSCDKQDDAGALFILGVRYSTGRDVEQDMIAAHKWLNLAATMGHEEAKAWRADIASEMTKAQIAEAQKQARAWLQARNAKRSRDTEEATPPQPVVKRPIYVRRHAQAMRSAQSFARVCACA